MDKREFDKFADEYELLHKGAISASGENTSFFAEYKVIDLLRFIGKSGYPANLRILDFGCGVGTSVPYFRKHLPKSRLTCLDVSRKSLGIGVGKYPGEASFVQFDGRHIPAPDGSYDLVFTACVFHHIPGDIHKFLVQEIYRVLAPGGAFMAFEHNPYNPLTARAVNYCAFDKNAVLIRGREFRALLADCGFQSTELNYRIFFPGPLRFLRFAERCLTWLPLGAQYYVIGEKLDEP